jgi:hypothetical protein
MRLLVGSHLTTILSWMKDGRRDAAQSSRMIRHKNPVALFSFLAPFVIAFMMGALAGMVISQQEYKAQCKRYFAYHPDAPFCRLVAEE